jgi:2-polyprenyl-3-methyl-5-hydroxy-6-metoxy-1,4-benzoquinol methylase
MSLDERVAGHFDAAAARFDAIYESDKGPIARFVDSVWRGVVRRRFELTLERLAPLEGKRILDVGCGPGRYCVAFALRGADRVTGLDIAPAMLDLAAEHARRAGVADRCEFRLGRFPESEAGSSDTYDVCTAMGYFDYVQTPAQHLARMRQLTSATIVASFPRSSGIRSLVRRVRFVPRRIPLFLYSRERLETIVAEAGIERFELVELDRDYVLFAAPMPADNSPVGFGARGA